MRLNNRQPAIVIRARIARSIFLLPLVLASCSRPKPAQPQTSSAGASSAQTPATAAISAPIAEAPAAPAPAAAVAIMPTELTATIPADAHLLEGMLQSGHSMPVTTLAFSPDGKWLASSGYDNTIILWDLSSGEELRRFKGHADAVMRVLFSPRGDRLLSSDLKGGVKEWDVNSGAVIAAFKVRNVCRSMAFSADGQKFVAGVDTGEEASNSRIEVRSADSGKLLRTIKTDWSGFTALAITPEGSIVASGGQGTDDDTPDLFVRTWDLATGAQTREVHAGGTAISADGHFVTDVDHGTGKITQIDLSTGNKRWEKTVNAGLRAVPSPDGQKLAISVSGSAALKIISAANGQILHEFPAAKQTDPGSIDAVAFSDDARYVAAAQYETEGIKIWDLSSGESVRALAPQTQVTGIAASPDGKWLVVGSGNAMWLWDLATRKRVKGLWSGSVNQMVFSADGKLLAANAGSRFPGETLKVWDTRNWTIVGEFSFPEQGTPVFSLAFVPNDSPLKTLGPLSRSFEFTADGAKHTVWSAPSPVSVSPDGKSLAAKVGIAGDVDIWDLHSGQKVRTIAAHKIGASIVAFSGDGKWLLTAGQETPVTYFRMGQISPVQTRVKVWDTATWTEHVSLAFNRVGVGAASLSPDSRMLIVEKDWNLVELFDVASGASLGTFTATDPRAQARPFSSGNLLITPDGETLMQAAQNGVRMWKLTRAHEAARPGN
jgi:WD40 repeat protein